MVKATFQTDPISALGLSSPVCIDHKATVVDALSATQRGGQGYVLLVEDGRPVGMMSEREVLMRIVARDVKYDSAARALASAVAATLTNKDRIVDAVRMMSDGAAANIPVVDEAGRAVAVVRTLDVIHFLAEAFPQQVLNLPPRSDQTMTKPEGA